MAILVAGKTECAICSRVIGDENAAVLFAHFVLNEADPLYPLSDAACHLTCAESDPLARAMLEACEPFHALTGPGKRMCAVCGLEVKDPDDYLLIGYLGDASSVNLAKFNCTHLHLSHISRWTPAAEFVALAHVYIESGLWKGPALQDIVTQVEARLK